MDLDQMMTFGAVLVLVFGISSIRSCFLAEYDYKEAVQVRALECCAEVDFDNRMAEGCGACPATTDTGSTP